jgi:alcohol dehydrogenase (NADP+)
VNEADANLALLPEGITLEQACMLPDMITTGFHGAELAEVRLGDVVLVIGIGPVGLMSVKGAALSGASRLFAVGSRKHCCDIAREYGATDIVDYKNGDISEQIMRLTNGRGVDKIIIAGGGCETFGTAIKCLRPGGCIGNVNYLGEGESIDIPRSDWGVGMGHKKINGGLTPGGRARMEKLSTLILAGKLDPAPLITHRFEGLDAVEPALLLMKDKPADLIKPVVLIHYDDDL